MKYPSSLEKKKKKKKNPWICPFDDYFALNILCMFNAIKLLYYIVLFAYVQKLDSMLILIRSQLKFLQANCGDPDQTPLTAASALRLIIRLLPNIELQLILIRNKLTFLQANCGDSD